MRFLIAAWLLLSLNAKGEESQPIHMANYAKVSDFENLAGLGVNTLLVDLSADGSDWKEIYAAAARYKLRLVPLIWGKGQAIWKWNKSGEEWELDVRKYPKSKGAKFLQFLRDNPAFLKQTFALYGFHEPLHKPKKTGPMRLKKFYQQITEVEFPNNALKVYGEDITMGWPQSDDCLTGVLDYETHNVYPFARAKGGEKYRAFDVSTNYFGPGTNDFDKVLKASIVKLDHRLSRYRNAKPAATGRRPKPIVLIQTFSSKQEEFLWNRMPEAAEMKRLASHLVTHRGDQVGGLAWYCFRNPSTEYVMWLQKNRYDTAKADRWQVMREIAGQLGQVKLGRPANAAK